MIRAYIVDDEEHILNLMEIFLKRIDEVEVIGRASNAYDALDAVRLLRPDVVFLDIEMPGMSGIELAERINNEQMDIQLIFVTAYDKYAVSAFELDAMDYLLKPLEMDRLQQTMVRIKKEVVRNVQIALQSSNDISESASNAPQLKIQALGGLEVFNEQMEHMKWRTSKEKELLGYLAVHAGNRIHRDVILNVLWQDENVHKAKIYLHTCVSYLRKDLRKLGFINLVKYEDEKYSLDMDQVEIDVFRLKSLLAKLSYEDSEAMEQMLSLYSGSLLMHCDYLWTLEEAESLELMMTELRQTLVYKYFREEEYSKAMQAGKQLLTTDPYNEEAYRILMRCYTATGKRDEAQRIYQQLVKTLEELQIKPSEETKRVFAEMNSQDH